MANNVRIRLLELCNFAIENQRPVDSSVLALSEKVQQAVGFLSEIKGRVFSLETAGLFSEQIAGLKKIEQGLAPFLDQMEKIEALANWTLLTLDLKHIKSVIDEHSFESLSQLLSSGYFSPFPKPVWQELIDYAREHGTYPQKILLKTCSIIQNGF